MDKGISSLIATVLLVAFTVGVGIIIYSFFSGTVKKTETVEPMTETLLKCSNARMYILGNPTCSMSAFDPSLVLNLQFNEGSGNTAYDSSGHNNNGAISGATWVPGWSGKEGDYALDFDGEDDYVEISDAEELRIGTSNFTLMCRVKFTSERVPEFFIIKGDENGGYTIDHYGGAIVSYIGPVDGSGWYLTTDGSYYNDSNWHHVALRREGAVASLWVDGELKATDERDMSYARSPTSSLYLAYPISYPYYYNGSLDDVRLYLRALSDDEISAIASGETISGTNESGYSKFIVVNDGSVNLGRNFTVQYIINDILYTTTITLDQDLTPGSSASISIPVNTTGNLQWIKIYSSICPGQSAEKKITGVTC